METQTYALSSVATLSAVAPALLPVPVLVPPQLADVKRGMTATARELDTAQTELTRMMRGSWPQAQAGRLQKARSFIERKRLLKTPSTIVYPVVGTIFAVGAGCIAAFGNNAPTVGAALAGIGLGIGYGVPLISVAISKLAKLQETRRKKYMLESKGLRKPIQRFAKATGNEKLQVGYGVKRLRDALDRAQLLAPEGLQSLRLVANEVDAFPAAEHDRARLYTTLAKLLVEPLTRDSIEALNQTLLQAAKDDRPVYAQAVYDLVFADRSRIASTPYDSRNRLLEVLTTSGAEPVIETGS